MHAFNHVSTIPGNTPICTCPPAIATALQNKKRRSGIKLAGSQLCIQPCSIWTVGQDLSFQSLSLADILRNLASQVIGIPGFRGVKQSRHSVLWFVSLLMEFCFNPWKRKVPHHQPESGGGVGSRGQQATFLRAGISSSLFISSRCRRRGHTALNQELTLQKKVSMPAQRTYGQEELAFPWNKSRNNSSGRSNSPCSESFSRKMIPSDLYFD